jgi:Mn-dependent DtxR family transcriptional regulator
MTTECHPRATSHACCGFEVTESVEHLIDAALGLPERDPHGDPIPRPRAEQETEVAS